MHFLLGAVLVLAAGCGDDGGMTADSGPGDAGGDGAAMADGAMPTELRWEQLPPPDVGPFGRWGFGIAALGDGRVLLIGGTTFRDVAGTVQNDTWLYDLRDGGFVPTEIETLGPTPRYCTCAAWDPVRERALLVGGQDDGGPLDPETWELDLGAQRWTFIDAETPPGVVGCALAYAPARDAFYLFGGASQTAGFSDRTYRYDPEARTWTELAVDGPSARYDAGLLALPDGNSLVLFAGSNNPMTTMYYSDVWVFDTSSELWTMVSADGAAGVPGRRTPWMVLDPAGGGFYAGYGAGGLDAGETLDDFYRFDLLDNAWDPIEIPGAPAPRGFTLALAPVPGALGVMLGGYDLTDLKREVWRLSR